MAKATVGAAGIEYIQGALKRPKKENGHKHGNYLVMTHRSAASTNPNCQRIYSFAADRYERSTVPQAKELAARARFASVSAAVKARSKDLMQQATDITNFLAQKDTAGGKKTSLSWCVIAAKLQRSAAMLMMQLWLEHKRRKAPRERGDAYDAALAGA